MSGADVLSSRKKTQKNLIGGEGGDPPGDQMVVSVSY